jgi:hypothetical protein
VVYPEPAVGLFPCGTPWLRNPYPWDDQHHPCLGRELVPVPVLAAAAEPVRAVYEQPWRRSSSPWGGRQVAAAAAGKTVAVVVLQQDVLLALWLGWPSRQQTTFQVEGFDSAVAVNLAVVVAAVAGEVAVLPVAAAAAAAVEPLAGSR